MGFGGILLILKGNPPPLLCRYIELKGAIKEVYEEHGKFWNAKTGAKDFPPESSARTFKTLLYARTNKVDMLHTEITRVLPLLPGAEVAKPPNRRDI